MGLWLCCCALGTHRNTYRHTQGSNVQGGQGGHWGSKKFEPGPVMHVAAIATLEDEAGESREPKNSAVQHSKTPTN